LNNRFYDEFGNSIYRENWQSFHIFSQVKKRHDFTMEIRENDNSRWIQGTSYSLDPKDTDNIIGMSDYDLPWMKEEAENYRRDDQRVIDTEKPSLHIIETQLQSDQKQKWLDTNKIPLKSPDGTITGILGTFQDITEMIESRQKIEELLRSENVKLEQLVQEKTAELEITMTEFMNREKLASLGSLVAGVSHEINTPLGVALSSSSFLTEKNKNAYQMLMDGEMTKEGLIEYMKTVEESTEILNNSLYRAAELVKSFKAISVSQSSEIFSDFDLRDYINSVILTMKHEYKRTVQSLQLLPDKEIWISADPSSFSQMITNLLMNSLKHAFEPSQEGRIIIELEDTEDHLSIRFEDNGKGIPQDRILRIFDPFYTTALNNGGSGLGLSIIYNIVTEKLHGKIDCQSIVDEGTVFLITIPWGENLKHG
jgi:signal transduction histidine kinase